MNDTISLAAGSVISHYRLEGKIGAGGMGEVYRAEDTTLNRPVAIKVLSAGVLQSVDRVRRFVQEARAASALNHPNIVTIYEIGQARLEVASDSSAPPPDPIHFIAMEYIEGETLNAAIKKHKDTTALLAVLIQVAEGLAKAHNAGIIHRDLKPDNIMITTDGYAKVVDFGLAKLTEQRAAPGSVELTQEGMVMGTVGYMSPEQIQGVQVDERSDIFALGCILYEVMGKRRAFQSDSAIDTMHKIMFSEPPSLPEINPAVSPEIMKIIGRCLMKNPEARYGSIRDVAVDLRAALSQPGLSSAATLAPTISVRGPRVEDFPAPPPNPSIDGSTSGAVLPSGGSLSPAFQASGKSLPVGGIIRLALLLAVVGLGAYLWVHFPPVKELADEKSRVAAATAAATRAGATDYQWLPASSMSAALRRSVLVTEDPFFFDRPVPKTRAEWTDVLHRAWKEHKIEVAPSPITVETAQQLYFGTEKPLDKAEAWLAAWSMEQILTRKQVMELYLNTAPFGGAVGVQAASDKFFDKTADELTPRQAAALIASLRNPTATPNAPDPALVAKQQSILDQLKQAGYSDEQKSATVRSKKGPARKHATTETVEASVAATSAEPEAPPPAN